MNTSENAIATIDLPLQPLKPRLTIEHVAALLIKNYNQSQIAKHFCVSRQAVNQFVDKHYDILQPLIDNTDVALAIKLKREAIEITNSIDNDDRKKASLQQKVTSAAICVEKYRLLADKSTSIVAYCDVSSQLENINKELAKYQIFDVAPQDVVIDPDDADNEANDNQ